MYNSPRAASIIAKTDGKVFELDRITFSHIVKQAAMNKRELYQKVIASVDLFSELNEYEKYRYINSDKNSMMFSRKLNMMLETISSNRMMKVSNFILCLKAT